MQEVAERLDVTTRTVRDLIYAGELDAYRFTEKGAYKIPEQALENFIEKAKVVVNKG